MLVFHLAILSGFYQIKGDDKYIKKPSFNNEDGHYEFPRMPFSLNKAPASFQRIMDNIFRRIQNEMVLIYLDGIIAYSASIQVHLPHTFATLSKTLTKSLKKGAEIKQSRTHILIQIV